MGVHHFYYGMLMVLIAFILAVIRKGRKTLIIIIFSLGFIIAYDDAYQHMRQNIDPSYRSPLHKAYGLVYKKSALVRNINRWLDGLFGKERENQ